MYGSDDRFCNVIGHLKLKVRVRWHVLDPGVRILNRQSRSIARSMRYFKVIGQGLVDKIS